MVLIVISFKILRFACLDCYEKRKSEIHQTYLISLEQVTYLLHCICNFIFQNSPLSQYLREACPDQEFDTVPSARKSVQPVVEKKIYTASGFVHATQVKYEMLCSN